MDTEKSNSSSFEDLSLSNDLKEPSDNIPVTNTDNTQEKAHDDVMDIIGTGQLTKKVSCYLLNEFIAFGLIVCVSRYSSKVIQI